MSALDVRDLELLQALERHHTLVAAADHLHVSQPALSQRLTRIEKRLGTDLFERRGRRLVANDAGRRMQRAANLALSTLHDAERDLRLLVAARSAPVHIASQCSSNYWWLPRVMRELGERHPGSEVLVEPTPDHDVTAAVLDGRLDVGIVTKFDSDTHRLVLTRLFDDELQAVVGPRHPWYGRSQVGAADFADVHLVLPDSYDQSRQPATPLPIPVDARPAAVSTPPITPDVLIETVIASDDAVTVMPSWIAAPYLASRDLVAVPIDDSTTVRTWYAATRHGRLPTPVHAFVDVLVGRLGGAPPRASAGWLERTA
jgi:LysR family transcriptional regulator for metE and metH